MKTQELLRRDDAFDVSDDRPVSSLSRLDDLVWDLDTDDPGYGPSGVRAYWWTHVERDGPPDEREKALLLLFQKLAWLSLADSSFGVAHKPSSIFQYAHMCSRFVRFMAREGLSGLDEITPAVIEAYCDTVMMQCDSKSGEAPEDDTRRRRLLISRLRAPWSVWQARHRLFRADIAVPSADPFARHSPKQWARRAVDAADDLLAPIPPEVFLRILNAATTMVTVHAPDVLAAQDRWFSLVGGFGSNHKARTRAAEQMAAFKFDTFGSSDLHWPASLLEPMHGTSQDEPTRNLAHLIASLNSACVLIVLATTGVRPNEFLAVPAGWDGARCLPECIRQERTPDGLMDVFLMCSRLSKGQIVPVEEEWVIGASPVGSAVPPLGVMALSLLERLMAPWRALSTDPVVRRSMYVRIALNGLPAVPGSIKRPLCRQFPQDLKHFYRDWVDFDGLPDHSDDHARTPLAPFRLLKGAQIRNSQYRKNYGQFLLRTDSGLLPALRVQYKHSSVVTLQYNYTGNSPRLLTGPTDEHRLASTRAIAGMLGFGSAATSGRLPEIISRHATLMSTTSRPVGTIGPEEADRRGLVLRPGEHGSCGIAWAPHLARCNQIAGTASFLNATPSFRNRNPTVCAGCPLFSVDRSHLPFWRRRHDENAKIWDQACAAGLQKDYQVADARRRMALGMIRQLEGLDE